MIRHILLFLIPFLIFSSAPVFADSLEKLSGSNFPDAQFTHKKFRPETMADLPFPSGAFVEMKKSNDAGLPENPDSRGEKMKRKDIEKQKAIQKLSLLLSYIYYKQKNMVGSYRGTDQAYQDLLKRNFPDPKAYDQAVSNYEDALKNYGEYEAYLSALPLAVSDYEKEMGYSFRDFVFQKADGAITLMKTPPLSDLSNSPDDLKVKREESTLLVLETPEEINPERGKAKEQEGSRREFCALMGAFAGATAVENVVLATLSNPMSALLGASLGAALCSENLYEKMTGLPGRLGKELLLMGSYIKTGLKEIGNGLYNIGREYLYKTPSRTGAKIAEHYEDTKRWLNIKLGWH